MARLPFYQFTAAWVVWVIFLSCTSVTTAERNSCSAVRSEYLRQGFQDEVPEHQISSSHLKLCYKSDDPPNHLTCCTEIMEHKLSVQSRQDFDTKLKKLLNPFANLLDKKHKKFDELFTNLLNFSQINFDRMFEKTYGVMYLQNADIFTDLFKSFGHYYKKGDTDMRVEMKHFFRKLYQKMFIVYNAQYSFSEDYLKCVNDHMEGLKPFGDDPEKLTTNINRSFVAFRTFVQGLATAASVVRNVLLVNPNVNCLHELMKMSHCSTCAGHQGVKPCLPYCRHVQELCLAHHLPLDNLWQEFAEAMQNLGDRLEGPFNIGHEVPPINLKISNAIMNFQESGLEISNKVFQGCGQPHLGRVARNAKSHSNSHGELDLESLDFSAGKRDDDAIKTHDEAITKLIREIKTKIKNSRDFWSELPSEMCKEARHHGASNCWTGKGLGRYEGSAILNLSNPIHSPQMDEQIFRLKLITNKMKEAYLGKDVSWMDEDWLGGNPPLKGETQDDERFEGSGSGWVDSSSSSGHSRTMGGPQYPPDDEDGYPENEEGSGVYGEEHEGSGQNDPTVHRKDHSHKNTNSITHLSPNVNPYDNVVPPFVKNPNQRGRENPSAAPAEKPMTLTWAVAVYLLPAVFTFLGTIG